MIAQLKKLIKERRKNFSGSLSLKFFSNDSAIFTTSESAFVGKNNIFNIVRKLIFK
ncbi:MAG: hypothetical protein KatS3mg095_0665 [Candidatus Parcubacteria bacterium]|nr:MAG: hypothetical protein KatS3mg095_0665 [Candidatus Parcubacteria bacterium]